MIILLKERLKGEQMRERDKSCFFFFNKALACPLCGLQCWIKTCFHLSPSLSKSTSPPPTQCQVLLWDTQWSACVCCCVRACVCTCCAMAVLLAGSSILKHLSEKLDYYWTTEEHSYLTVKHTGFFSSSLSLWTHTHTHTRTNVQGCMCKKRCSRTEHDL